MIIHGNLMKPYKTLLFALMNSFIRNNSPFEWLLPIPPHIRQTQFVNALTYHSFYHFATFTYSS